MLVANNAGTPVDTALETDLITWTADGSKYFLGFMASGDVEATYRLKVTTPGATGPEVQYLYKTSAQMLTAYVVDRAIKLTANTVVTLTVEHTDAAPQNFYGTLLGGNN
jgi:hypothetical protein